LKRKPWFFIFLILGIPAFGQVDNLLWEKLHNAGVYENYEVRINHQATIMAKSFEAVNAPKRVYLQKESNSKVRFEIQKTATDFYIMFINELENKYPVWSSGSYIFKKDLKTGDLIQVKIFLFNNEETFIRVYPDGNRSRLDVHLFGNIIYSGIRVPLEFERLSILPLYKIVELTQNKIGWDNLLTDISFKEYSDVEIFSKELYNKMPLLGDNDDGAYNEKGEMVFIETLEPQLGVQGLNCSGFVKWTVDNLYYDLMGEFMAIEPLKVKHYDLRGNSWSNKAEDLRDPYFGLDWTRNISFVYRKELYPYSQVTFTSQDINSVPYFKYKENVGYPVEEIMGVLFLDAIKNPGRIYLGSVNTLFGSENKLRQHIHVVAFLPYFDANGIFRVDVIERQAKTSIESLLSRYKGEFIHLVNVELHNRRVK